MHCPNQICYIFGPDVFDSGVFSKRDYFKMVQVM